MPRLQAEPHIGTCMTLVALFAVALWFNTVAPAADSGPGEGAAAPEFTLTSQEGNPVNLTALHGKWVVLYFYPKDFTSGCTIEAHNFQRDLKEYEAKNAVILGVSVDSVDSHKNFCSKEGLNFKLLADTNHQVAQKYDSLMENQGNIYAARNTFIIDPWGVIRKVYKKVNPNKHSEEVLAALADLQKTYIREKGI